MFIGDQLGLANSDIFGQGILEIGQGKVSEKSGNFTFYSLWEPCQKIHFRSSILIINRIEQIFCRFFVITSISTLIKTNQQQNN